MEGDSARIVGSAPPSAEVKLDVSRGRDPSVRADDSGRWQYDAELTGGENTFEFFLQEDPDVRMTLHLMGVEPLPTASQEAAGPLLITVDGGQIEVGNGKQAELVLYHYALELIFAPADENIAAWREIRALSLDGSVTSVEYYEFLVQSEIAFDSLANRLMTDVAVPESASGAHALYVLTLRKRSEGMGHLAVAIGDEGPQALDLAREDFAQALIHLIDATVLLFDLVKESGLNPFVLDQMFVCRPERMSCSIVPPHPPDALRTPIAVDPRGGAEHMSGRPRGDRCILPLQGLARG